VQQKLGEVDTAQLRQKIVEML
jgi:hypothetical protein